MKYLKEFELAKNLAVEVGVFLDTQSEKIIESQIGKDIKLELDKTSEEMFINTISKEFDYPILSEEIGLTKITKPGQVYWVVDPIDGTLNFSRNNPACCISLALWVDKEPIFGVVYDFNRKELFSGYVGSGAWLNDEELQPHQKREKSQSILATGFPTYMNDDEETLRCFISNIQNYKKIRMIGSAALSLAYVACGRFDVYIENNIKLWDIAAGVAINKAIDKSISIQYLDNYSTNSIVESR